MRVAVRCTSVVVASVGHLPHTPSSSGELQSFRELALCVLIVVLCLAVAVECADHVWSGRVARARLMSGFSWSAPTHSEQFRCASTIARACIVCVDCCSVFGSGGRLYRAPVEWPCGACTSDVWFQLVTSHTLRPVQVRFNHCQSLHCVC